MEYWWRPATLCCHSVGEALESKQTWEREREQVHTGGEGGIFFPAPAGAQVPAGEGWKLGPGNGAASLDSRPGTASSLAAEMTDGPIIYSI